MAFLRTLAKNNHREWFQPRKEEYERLVREPMVRLVDELNRAMLGFAPEYVNDARKAIYRVYRDTRFSPDKTPYKTHIAAVFPRRGMEKHGSAGLYFSVSPKEVEVAGGVYLPGPEQLLAIRGHIAEHYGEFERILRARKLRELMGELQGEQLSRTPKGFADSHPAAHLLRYKQWLYWVLLDPPIATTPQLYDEVLKRFRVMVPLIDFLNAPLVALRKRPAAEAFLSE